MKFQISREALLKPLTLVAGVVERRQTLPILSNVLLQLEEDNLTLTGTDLEVELRGRVSLETEAESGQTSVPARKLLDICKSLPEGSRMDFTLADDENRVTVKSGRSRFTLSTLPAADFPVIEESDTEMKIDLPQTDLKRLIDRTGFAMAQQDVRYYLNGMLWEVTPKTLRLVATDGHRLAMSALSSDTIQTDSSRQMIVPRKGVQEINRLLQDEEPITVTFGKNHIQARTHDITFTSKLVDGKFPDYQRVLPKGGTKKLQADREVLRQALSRTAILSNEKYRGIRMTLSDSQLQLVASNPDQEEAEETVEVSYQGDELEVGFNVSYLLDVLGALNSDQVVMTLSDANSSALLEAAEDDSSVYVVMPMRL